MYNKTLSLKYSIFYQCLYFVYFCISISFFQHDLVFACNLNFNYRSRLNLVRFSVSRKNSRLQTINDTFYFISLQRYQNFRDFISKILKEIHINYNYIYSHVYEQIFWYRVLPKWAYVSGVWRFINVQFIHVDNVQIRAVCYFLALRFVVLHHLFQYIEMDTYSQLRRWNNVIK